MVMIVIALITLQGAVQAQWTTPDANGNINNTNSGNVGVGTTSPNTRLTVTANASNPPAAPLGSIIYFSNPDNANTFLTADAYGAFHADFLFRQARGTQASPSASQADTSLGRFKREDMAQRDLRVQPEQVFGYWLPKPGRTAPRADI